jgi:hypothetical protein
MSLTLDLSNTGNFTCKTKTSQRLETATTTMATTTTTTTLPLFILMVNHEFGTVMPHAAGYSTHHSHFLKNVTRPVSE